MPLSDAPDSEAPDPLRIHAWAAAQGDHEAFGTLVQATQVEVWRFLAALTDPTQADDLTQDTYLRAYRALPRFRGESSVRTWLLAIARRVAVDQHRRRSRRPRLTRPPAPEDWVMPDQAGHTDLAQLVAGLEARRREAFALTQLLGLSYDEAARVCDVPVGTIRSRVARARADLVRAVAASSAPPAPHTQRPRQRDDNAGGAGGTGGAGGIEGTVRSQRA